MPIFYEGKGWCPVNGILFNLNEIPAELRDCFEEVEVTCGAPWRRVVEKKREATRPGTSSKIHNAPTDDAWGRHSSGVVGNRDPERHCTTTQTLGWKPSCKCPEHEPIPSLILDPFCGAATTGLVALRLGRRFIGIELNPQYVELGTKRLVNDNPLFNGFMESQP